MIKLKIEEEIEKILIGISFDESISRTEMASRIVNNYINKMNIEKKTKYINIYKGLTDKQKIRPGDHYKG